MKFIDFLKDKYKETSDKNKIIKEYNNSIKIILEDMYDSLNFRPYDIDQFMELTEQLKNIQEERYEKLKNMK